MYEKASNVVREINRNGPEGEEEGEVTFVVSNNGETQTIKGAKTGGPIRIVTRNGEIVEIGEICSLESL